MSENTMLAPDRFIWRGGKPVFDILKNLISPNESDHETSIDCDFRAKFESAEVDELLSEREKLKSHNKMLDEKINLWKKDILQIKNARLENSQKLLEAILWADPKQIDTQKPSDISPDDIASWIGTAQSAKSANDKSIHDINRKLSIEFSKIQSKISDELQAEIDKLTQEILKINNEFRAAISGIATEYEFEIRGGIDDLKLYDVPHNMIPGPMLNRHRTK